MRHNRFVWLAMIAAITVGACGGSSGTATPGATQTGNPAGTPVRSVESSAPGTTASTSVAVPIARFTAHGRQAANTIGPGCATGIDTRGGDTFRFTPPPTWAWRGTSGGSSYDQVSLSADDVRMFVTEAAYDEEREALDEFTIVGPSGVEVEIDGTAVPIIRITLKGAPGYAIVDLPYLGPLPVVRGGFALGTVALTSDETGRPTIEEATELLGSVRIERCEAVSEAMIWGPAVGVHLVPRFEPDPLGKVYPDQAQPQYRPTTWTLDAYSLEQVAYLMPVDADRAMCAAAKAVEANAGNPVGHLAMFLPNGTNKAALDAIVAAC